MRLRRLDRFVVWTRESLLRRPGTGAFVDVGYGARPTTTLESAAHFRQLNPHLHVIGVEIDPERVARAAHAVDPQTDFRRGGFEIPLKSGESARLIRAMNVLRQYDESSVAGAHQQMLSHLRLGGLLLEGTSNPSGSRMVVNLLEKTRNGPLHTVLFSSNVRHPMQTPRDLQPVLPKNLIHQVVPGSPIFGLMADWQRAWEQTRAPFGPRVHFVEAGLRLMQTRSDIIPRRSLLRRGMLLWRVPR